MGCGASSDAYLEQIITITLDTMNNTNQTTILAGSILIGFALIAAAIFFSNPTVSAPAAQAVDQVGDGGQGQLAMMGSPKREEGEPRNIYGNPDAETTIVEFSDYECPFCARLHPTLKQVVDESEGKINWEYRHLPLSIHASAEPAAIASECVADLAGNEAFWDYSTAILANQRGLTATFLQEQAVGVGVDAQAYGQCITSTEVASRVDADAQRAAALGGSGTPFNVVEFADGTTRVASGALPYANWAQIFANK